ncbi:hypothetical protein ACH4RG_02220 [Streptomyces sp. NPDC021019]|uniref:hypothetical protein n=1 Tax=Streptomyces sp. NPDC021019 TaxID=3365108 RepID=UPI00378E4AA3
MSRLLDLDLDLLGLLVLVDPAGLLDLLCLLALLALLVSLASLVLPPYARLPRVLHRARPGFEVRWCDDPR